MRIANHPPTPRSCIVALLVFIVLGTASAWSGELPGDHASEWFGYRQLHFKVDSRECLLVVPETTVTGRPWIWRTEFFGHEPQADLALLARGFHVAYIDVQNLYGGPTAMVAMDRFYDHLIKERKLSDKTVLEGFSRGGLFSLNWAARHPARVACIYNDAPVCDFRSWPGGKGSGPGSPEDWQRCLAAYGITEAEAAAYKLTPVDQLAPLAKFQVPLLHVCGDADEVVPFQENTQLLASRYRDLGGPIAVIAKPGVRHHPHSLANPSPIVCFILKHTLGAGSSEILCESPVEYQIAQRTADNSASVHLSGWIVHPADRFEYRVLQGHSEAREATSSRQQTIVDWTLVPVQEKDGRYQTTLELPAGGWYSIELRTQRDGRTMESTFIEHVGVGEVFVIAGQSNSTNYGSEKQQTQTQMVSTFDGRFWRIANDPQPGTADGSRGGSFAPAFGDALYKHYQVPIAIASTGAGATSVRQWLPKGARMRNLPTIDAYVSPVAPDEWACDGVLFEGLVRRMEALGSRGCRAVLWHQGESDAGQARSGYPADRQITGKQYSEFMQQLIASSRKRLGWEVPWIVAQTTYHSETDAADEEFRGAQQTLWETGLAIQGPDTDRLRAEYRDGVHFNAKGLKAHGEAWAARVIQWLDQSP